MHASVAVALPFRSPPLSGLCPPPFTFAPTYQCCQLWHLNTRLCHRPRAFPACAANAPSPLIHHHDRCHPLPKCWPLFPLATHVHWHSVTPAPTRGYCRSHHALAGSPFRQPMLCRRPAAHAAASQANDMPAPLCICSAATLLNTSLISAQHFLPRSQRAQTPPGYCTAQAAGPAYKPCSLRGLDPCTCRDPLRRSPTPDYGLGYGLFIRRSGRGTRQVLRIAASAFAYHQLRAAVWSVSAHVFTLKRWSGFMR